jgi:hypothetical protein
MKSNGGYFLGLVFDMAQVFAGLKEIFLESFVSDFEVQT